MTGFVCTVARRPSDIAEAQRIRWQVYGEEEKLLPASAGLAGREIDARDDDGGTLHLLLYAGSEPAGTVRLLPARHDRRATAEDRLGLELETTFDLRGYARRGVVAAEITRYCVLRRFRGTGAAAALYAALWTESQRRGITHWFAAANMETDCAEDAALTYHLVRGRGLFDARSSVRPRLAGVPQTPRRRPYFSEEQRRSARGGAFDHLAIPRTLALFARGMGARYIGPPAYDRYFEIFALPLLALPAQSSLLAARSSRLASRCRTSCYR